VITYLQAIIIGILQGVTELFPISSLGHSVLLPSLFGWHNIVAEQAKTESYFLSFLVILHLATATALFIFYRKEWFKIIKGFFTSIRHKSVQKPYEKLAWLIIIATIPVGLIGLMFEHALRVIFTKPLYAAVFLVINGFILLAGDVAIKNHQARKDYSMDSTTKNTSGISLKRAAVIGTSQAFALFAGISRSGITMVSGLYSGLDYEDAARFSFLLATPVIFAAGLYKLPNFLGHTGDGVRMQTLVGGIAAGIAAYMSVRFLDKYFKNQRLRPFAIYCLAFGSFMIVFQLLKT
jgi:undecaprenyl-diphosphatase